MRESGILMHLTSLPGPYGVGTMGKNAFAFVDFLKEAGQSCWQVLPLNPTGYGNSPYQSCSTFAGNHYLIDLELLVEEGLLKKEEVEAAVWSRREDRVDFGLLHENRLKVLRLAFRRYGDTEAFARFRAANDRWLPDYGLYMALKEQNGGKPWYQWEDDLKYRDVDVMDEMFITLAPEIRFHCFVQFLFARQWRALRDYAHKNKIRIIGDVPIYVPLDSVDVWANPELYQLDEELAPVAVAGCPPDAFSENGQLWGNPLYRWDIHKKTGYRWWLDRLAAAGQRYDTVRLDHFRGFEAYWAIPYGDKTAKNGVWVQGPGMDFIKALKRNLPELDIIAEDLGFLTREVLELRDRSGYPGMKVLEFAFDGPDSAYLPYNHTPNTVCYIGTHDNMTCRQWLETAEEETLAFATAYMHLSKREGPVWGVIRTAMGSVSNLCLTQMQDFLELDGEGRMNFPGTLSDSNWTWRAKSGIMGRVLAKRIRRLTETYGRLGHQKETLCKTQNIKLGE